MPKLVQRRVGIGEGSQRKWHLSRRKKRMGYGQNIPGKENLPFEGQVESKSMAHLKDYNQLSEVAI